MAPLHGGSSAGKSDLCCDHSVDVVGRPGLHRSGLMSICFAGCLPPGPRKNDLTIYWALGPFVRSFTLLVDPGDIYPPHLRLAVESQVTSAPATEPNRDRGAKENGQAYGVVSACAGGRMAAGVLLLIVVGIVVQLLVALRGRLRLVAVVLIDNLGDVVVVRIILVLRLVPKKVLHHLIPRLLVRVSLPVTARHRRRSSTSPACRGVVVLVRGRGVGPHLFLKPRRRLPALTPPAGAPGACSGSSWAALARRSTPTPRASLRCSSCPTSPWARSSGRSSTPPRNSTGRWVAPVPLSGALGAARVPLPSLCLRSSCSDSAILGGLNRPSYDLAV
jgi:hypothetical protein